MLSMALNAKRQELLRVLLSIFSFQPPLGENCSCYAS